MHTGNSILTLKNNDAKCDKTKCGFRVGILAMNGKIDEPTDSGIIGTPAARNHFYQGDT